MSVRVIVGFLVGTALAASGAQAAGLRAGGALSADGGTAVTMVPLGAGARPASPPVGEPDLRLGFTPRAGSGFLLEAGEERGGSLDLRLGLAPASGGLGRLDGLGILSRPQPYGASPGDPGPGLAIGGALAWSGWSVGGTYSGGALAGSELDVWTGQLGYGPVTARLGYGQETTVGRPERELWLFGTDVTTWSWLTVEGDVAVTTQTDREPTTVGRLGLRLNF